MSSYCCDKKCFEAPDNQVDGIACNKCENFSYCMCKCKSLQQIRPTLLTLRLYRTQHYFTCCNDMCSKFKSYEFSDSCSECHPKAFCECKLKLCKNRTDWTS